MIRPHSDDSAVQHGFVALIPEGGCNVGIVWLDGRKMMGPGGAMMLMYSRWNGRQLGPELVLDPDVCSCCQTSAVRVDDDLLIAYRDHTGSEIRDISLVRFKDGRWTDPRPLNPDGWKIAGCPVNGPAMDAGGSQVAVAWFTAPDQEPQVLVSLSSDGGERFGEPLRLDGGDPLGRVDLKMLEDGSVFVSWLEKVAGGAQVRLRRVDADGSAGEPVTLGITAAGRPSGFPRIAAAGERLFVSWTDPGPPSEVKLARLDL